MINVHIIMQSIVMWYKLEFNELADMVLEIITDTGFSGVDLGNPIFFWNQKRYWMRNLLLFYVTDFLPPWKWGRVHLFGETLRGKEDSEFLRIINSIDNLFCIKIHGMGYGKISLLIALILSVKGFINDSDWIPIPFMWISSSILDNWYLKNKSNMKQYLQ